MQPIETWRDELVNDFEQSVFALHPEIGDIKQRLYDLGAVYAAMSGSGSAVFGLFRNEIQLDKHFSTDFFTCCVRATARQYGTQDNFSGA